MGGAFGPLAAICLILGTLAADRLADPDPGAAQQAVRGFGTGVGILGALGVAALLRMRTRRPGEAGARPPGMSGFGRLFLVGLAAGLLFSASGLRQAVRFLEAERDADRAWQASVAEPGIRWVEGTVTGRVERAWGTQVELARVAAGDAGPAVPTRLRLRWNRSERRSRADRLLWPGVRVVAAVRIRPLLGPRNPGTPDRARAARRRGLAAEAKLVGAEWLMEIEGVGRARARLARARAAIRAAVLARLGEHGEGSGLAAALAIGDRRWLAGETRDALRALGLAHLIAVSGLHVGLVGLGAAALVRWLGARCPSDGSGARAGLGSPASGITALLAAWGYGWLTGAAPAAQRAVFALAGALAGRALARPIGAGAALGWAACGLLLVEPALVFDLGAQLSFAACVGLLRAMPGDGSTTAGASVAPDRGGAEGAVAFHGPALHRRRGAVARALRVSLGASFATAPIVAAAGWALPIWGPILNLVALPAMAVVILPAALVAAASACLELTPLAAGGLAVVALFEEGLRRVAGRVAPPVADGGSIASPLTVLLGSPLTVLLGSLIGLAGLRRMPTGALVVLWVVLAAAGGGPARIDPRLDWPAPPRVVFFDVGQGDAALVQTADRAFLVDTGHAPGVPSDRAASGSGGGSLGRALRALGVTRLDGLIVSHGDADHAGGVGAILSTLPVGRLVMPAAARSDPRLARLASLARSRAIDVVWASRGDRLAESRRDASRTGRGIVADVLWPPESAGHGPLGWNDRSLVVRFDIAGRRFLFTGDIGRRAEAALLEAEGRGLAADVLKLPHHGSASAASSAFLAAVAARHAVLSAPCLPTRGLPRREVLERVAATGARLRWTGRDGALGFATTAATATWEGRPFARQRPCERALGPP